MGLNGGEEYVMSADTDHGNREDIIKHCVDAVAVLVRNTFVGKIVRGLVLMIQAMVKLSFGSLRGRVMAPMAFLSMHGI